MSRKTRTIPLLCTLAVAVAAASIWSCGAAVTSAGASAEGDGHAALARQVREAEIAFARTMADRDHEAFATHVSEEAVFFGGASVLRGRAAVAAGWAAFFEGPQAPFSWEPEQVEVLESGTLALSTGPVFDPAGKRAGTFISTWRLDEDGVWRVVFDRGCPPCEAAAQP